MLRPQKERKNKLQAAASYVIDKLNKHKSGRLKISLGCDEDPCVLSTGGKWLSTFIYVLLFDCSTYYSHFECRTFTCNDVLLYWYFHLRKGSKYFFHHCLATWHILLLRRRFTGLIWTLRVENCACTVRGRFDKFDPKCHCDKLEFNEEKSIKFNLSGIWTLNPGSVGALLYPMTSALLELNPVTLQPVLCGQRDLGG